MTMRNQIKNKYYNDICKLDDLYKMFAVEGQSQSTIRVTMRNMVQSGEAVRLATGVYGIFPKKRFEKELSQKAKEITKVIKNQSRYIPITVMETKWLSELMELQPFSSIICVEVPEVAVESVIQKLRGNNFEAFSKRDTEAIQKYATKELSVVVGKSITISDLKDKTSDIKIPAIEKILIDLICDDKIYVQYQGRELENIFMNAIEKYAINYSTILRYAGKRNRFMDAEKYLMLTNEYRRVRDFLNDKERNIY